MIFLGWFSHVGLGLMIFSCSEGFDGGQGFCMKFCIVLGLFVLGFGKNMKNVPVILAPNLKNNESNNNNNNNNNNKIRFKSLFVFNLV